MSPLEELKGALTQMLGASSRSSARQEALARYLRDRLALRLPVGLRPYLRSETKVPGLAREKKWDLTLVYPASGSVKPRLLVSLKSIMANPSGSWPNRLDDLVGEVSSVQILFPEVVVGYVVVLDYGAPDNKGNVPKGDENRSHYESFKAGLRALAQRRPPLWAQGLIEGYWVIEIDTRRQDFLLEPQKTLEEGEAFLKTLLDALREREPLLFLNQGQ
ncbi:hypothetical protein [Thermus filiformis]|uniref:Restriction endonuclease n=1 Tax=Thermus filiformis TaxID=276 RepID=A0A0D6XCS5_THEFI|nr:hypothetical protein [Thermus filiformis]KIX84688.1 hypothetical protein THFILI_03505 [Thermus filiformis]